MYSLGVAVTQQCYVPHVSQGFTHSQFCRCKKLKLRHAMVHIVKQAATDHDLGLYTLRQWALASPWALVPLSGFPLPRIMMTCYSSVT